MNFDKKTKLTNVFEKFFDNDEIQKNYVNFEKQFIQIIDQIRTKKLKKKTTKTRLFQLNCMLRRRMFNT